MIKLFATILKNKALLIQYSIARKRQLIPKEQKQQNTVLLISAFNTIKPIYPDPLAPFQTTTFKYQLNDKASLHIVLN